MKLLVSADEVVALLRAFRALPAAVHEPRLVEGGLDASVDPGALPGASATLRLAATLLGRIPLAVRDRGLREGVWTLRVDARLPAILAGALPDPSALLIGFLRKELAPLGEALVDVRPGDGEGASALVRLDTAAALGLVPLPGLRLESLSVSPSGIELHAALAVAPA